MNIIVTGASGLVGSSCVWEALRHPSYSIKAVTRRSGMFDNAVNVETLHTLEEIDTDLRYDLLIHAAAATPNNTDVSSIESINHKIDRDLYSFLANGCIRTVVYLSTMSVYGKIQSSYISENTPSNDPDGYGRSKREGEELVRSSGVERKMVLRLPGVVGKGMPRVFFRKCYESLCNGQEITIRSRDSLFNNSVYVSDIYRTCMSFATGIGDSFKILNHHSLDVISLGDMLDAFARKLKVKAKLRETEECGSPFLITNDGCEEDIVTRRVLSIIDAYLAAES
jgi:nucleoside-diphosphate-sugar epimerase